MQNAQVDWKQLFQRVLQKWRNQLLQANTKSNENFGVFFQFMMKTRSFFKKNCSTLLFWLFNLDREKT
jgi:hypothetical protein